MKGSSQQRFWVGLLLLTLAGAALRFWNLQAQIPIGDEWHTINRILRGGYKEIYTSFGLADHCIPLTLYAKYMAKHFGLTELAMMAPSAVIGTLMIPLLALWVRKAINPRTALTLAILLTISPLLVFFSRIGRPYIFNTLLAGPVLWSARSAWKTGKPSWFIAYGLGMPLIGWLHLSALPLALAPLPILAVESLFLSKNQRWPALRRAIYLGCAALLPALLLIGTPILYTPEALLSKASAKHLTRYAVFYALRLMSGDAGTVWFAVSALLFSIGFLNLLKLNRAVTLYFTTALLLQIGAVLILNPVGIRAPVVLARYLICLLPAGLLAISFGIQTLCSYLESRHSKAAFLQLTVLPALGALLFAQGPLTSLLNPNWNWPIQTIWVDMVRGTVPGIGDRAETMYQYKNKLPGAYRHIVNRTPHPKRILVTPWIFYMQSNPLPHYQQACNSRMYVGQLGHLPDAWPGNLPGETPPDSPLFTWRNMLDLTDSEAIAKAQINGIVLHKDLMHEAELSHHMPELRLQLYKNQAALVPLARAYLEHTYGPPEFEDDATAYFAVMPPQPGHANP